MPLYAGYLALFYSPEITDDEYFLVAKRWNIWLSLALLAALAVIFARQFPPLVAVNLTGIVAFGYFVFKAGYAQSELLFYFLFFLTFLAFWSLLRRRERPVPLWLACAAGAFAGLAHLTKAAMFPFVALFAGVFTVFALVGPARHRGASLVRAVAVPVVVGATFLALLSPYLVNSKRTFGRYFYHVTLFYVWYDNWAQASVGMYRHGDGVGWPDMPADQIPSAAKYWRSHTVGQIAARVAGGFKDMAVRSYRTYGYLKYVVLFLATANDGHPLEHVGVHQSRAPEPGARRFSGPVRPQPSAAHRVLRADLRHGHDEIPHRPPDAVLLRGVTLPRAS